MPEAKLLAICRGLLRPMQRLPATHAACRRLPGLVRVWCANLRASLVGLMVMGAALAGAGVSTSLPPVTELGAWRAALLPRQKLPETLFSAGPVDGRKALRIESNGSYGNRLYRIEPGAAAQGRLAWQWRVDRFPLGADLRRREGDDTAVKVCVMFDLPMADVPFIERQKLRLARLTTGEHLPAATLCYVWDGQLPAGTGLPNAYTPRLRWLVLRGRETPPGAWQAERRDLRTDFLAAFGHESREAPPIIGVLVGADADNTGSSALAYVSDLEWQP